MILEPSAGQDPRESCLTSYVEGLFQARGPDERLTELAVREVASAMEAYARNEGSEIVETSCLAAMASSVVRALGRDDLAIDAFIIGSRIVYPQQLACVENAPVWVINTELLFPDIDRCTELAFFSALHRIIIDMVHLWDAASGRGALGIRKMRLIARHFAGSGGRSGMERWLVEIRQAVFDRMLQLSAGRGWKHVPQVLMLD